MIRKLFKIMGTSVLVYFVIALGLIASQRPVELPKSGDLDFSKVMKSRFETPESEAFRRADFTARDGTKLNYTHVRTQGSEALPLVIMVHGSSWYGGQYDALAWALRDVAEVKAITLRGHGLSPETRGDVAYIGQLEDDIADLIADSTQDTSRQIVLLGHSSGGGLVVRFAGGAYGDKLAGAVLLAPFLKHDAPTTRQDAGVWAYPMVRRIIGLSMLNAAGIHALDRLTVIQFLMPDAVLNSPMGGYATTAYSWRLNASYAPRRDYLADVARLPDFLLVVGRNDETFFAEGYAPLMSGTTGKGRYEVVDGAAHLDIVDHARSEALIREYLSEL